MKELKNDYPTFRLIDIKLKLRTDFYYSFLSKKNESQVVVLPDSVYGQWLILDVNKKPKYFFNAINNDGTLNNIAKFAEKREVSDMESFLISMLNKKGHNNLNSIKGSPAISFKKRTEIIEYDLFQLVD